jgi:hypothetical protein
MSGYGPLLMLLPQSSSYHYYLTGHTEFGFVVLTGLVFKSQTLLGCTKIFNMLGGVPITLQIDGEGNLNTPIVINYLERARECEVTTSTGAHFCHGKVDRLHATIKDTRETLTMERNKNDQDQDKTVWEVQYDRSRMYRDFC